LGVVWWLGYGEVNYGWRANREQRES